MGLLMLVGKWSTGRERVGKVLASGSPLAKTLEPLYNSQSLNGFILVYSCKAKTLHSPATQSLVHQNSSTLLKCFVVLGDETNLVVFVTPLIDLVEQQVGSHTATTSNKFYGMRISTGTDQVNNYYAEVYDSDQIVVEEISTPIIVGINKQPDVQNVVCGSDIITTRELGQFCKTKV